MWDTEKRGDGGDSGKDVEERCRGEGDEEEVEKLKDKMEWRCRREVLQRSREEVKVR